MRMRSTALLALGLMLAGTWPHGGATGQTSIRPPVSIAPPNASPAPNPAADYDGFSAGVSDDNDTSSQEMPPVRSRAAKGSRSNPDSASQSSLDQEDDALKRKLTICKNCK
jgi:hypothetical protein